jgi:hypothetical protein
VRASNLHISIAFEFARRKSVEVELLDAATLPQQKLKNKFL